LTKLNYRDYGFDCGLVVSGDAESAMGGFGVHNEEKHGIDYSKDVLIQFILRKT